MTSPCPNATLRLGYTSENFPTFFQDENTGIFTGINVMFWKELANRFNCFRTEYVQLSNEDYICSNRYCPDAVALGINRGIVFADADGSVLDPNNVLLHKHSSLSDSSKLLFVDARTPLRDGPLDVSLYVVYTPPAAALFLLSFLCRTILHLIHKRMKRREVDSYSVFNLIRTMLNLIEFVNRLAQLFVILILVSYYQSVFNGNSAIEILEPPTPFATLLNRLSNGTERLVVSDGLLMANEMASFGPGTTSYENSIDRFHQICYDSTATGIFYEDELTEVAFFSVEKRLNCKLSKIVVDDVKRLSLPRLTNQFDRGIHFFFLMPIDTRRNVVKSVNRMLSTVFRFDFRAYYVKKFIPSRGIKAATQEIAGATVENQARSCQFYFRPISIDNLFYPFVAFAVGICIAVVAAIIERIILVCSLNDPTSATKIGILRVGENV